MRFALFPLLAVLTGGCANEPPEGPNLGRLGLTPEAPEVDIRDYSAPEQAGPFRLQGEMTLSDQQKVIFRYALDGAGDRRLDISLYPLPPGWHDLPDKRVVSGHYGQIRQAFADRAMKRPGMALRPMEERLRQVEGLTVAEGILLEQHQGRSRLIIIAIASLPEVFVRLTASAPEAVGQEHERDAREALATFLRHQPQAQSSK